MSKNQSTDTNQHLTFRLGHETFALDISNVREVLEMPDITKIPHMPPYICGVINLRGHAVPVLDMRVKFDMEPTPYTVDTCIIIIDAVYEGQSSLLGGLVDGVSEVLELPENMIDPPPKMGAAVNVEFIKGMGRIDDRFIIIVDSHKVFSDQEISTAHELLSTAPAA